jgi:hypothetical protein
VSPSVTDKVSISFDPYTPLSLLTVCIQFAAVHFVHLNPILMYSRCSSVSRSVRGWLDTAEHCRTLSETVGHCRTLLDTAPFPACSLTLPRGKATGAWMTVVCELRMSGAAPTCILTVWCMVRRRDKFNGALLHHGTERNERTVHNEQHGCFVFWTSAFESLSRVCVLLLSPFHQIFIVGV